MTENQLPRQIIDFVVEHIDSALQLEILLLLYSQPQKAWTPAELDQHLRINTQWIATQLADLCRRSLLRCHQSSPPTYQYGPGDPRLAESVDALATWYATHRVAILTLIYSKPPDALRTFAGAFRLRKEKPNG